MESVSISGYVHLNMLVVNNPKHARSFLFIEVVVQVKAKGDLDSFRRFRKSHHLTETHPVYPHQFFSYSLKQCRSIMLIIDEERIYLHHFLSVYYSLKATACLSKCLMLLQKPLLILLESL